MATSVVTGGAGFLGSWLCRDLLKKGHKVICIDNLRTGSNENVETLKMKKNFFFINQDITKPVEIEGGVDYIFHLASPASPKYFTQIPIEIMLVNSLGTLNMLNIAAQKNAKFLLASTSEVYGDPKEYPQKETYFGNVNPIGPRACYDESKRFAEALTMSFHRQHNLQCVTVRIFNAYGPGIRIDDGRAIPTFIAKALRNEAITIYGSGRQTRSFCFVSDIAEGMQTAMFSKYSGEVFNLGNPDEKRIIDIAKLIIRLPASKSKIIFRKMTENDPAKRKPDITKARKMLKWKPKVKFEDGIRQTIEWFKDRI